MYKGKGDTRQSMLSHNFSKKFHDFLIYAYKFLLRILTMYSSSKEQQRLILENENLKSQLQTIEKEKCDIAELTAQLENKLVLQEKK